MSETDIAIVGLSVRVPGAKNKTEFWENLVRGVESVRRYTTSELLEAGERSDLLQRPNYVPAGAPLGDMPMFDGEFFGFSPKESAILDPQHRHFMECAWEALEDAGHPPEAFAGPIGVYAGCGMGSYFYFNLCTRPELVDSVGMFLLRHTGNDKDFLATRVSYLMNLRGPSINIQTACSTSLVAVHQAAQSLLNGECDMALAGGVTIELPHRRGYLYQEREILSPDGHCYAFDHRAQGTVFGSGCGVVVLRRLQDALDEGDNIYAVIKGSAVNNDGGRKAGYLAPSVDGQASAITEALALANVSADTIQYVECHGTGTYLGDPLEVSALTQAFRETSQRTGYCKIGSVKTNIGHLDTAAGVVGLIKVCLSLQKGLIAPSLNFERPNPTIDFETGPFRVAAEATPFASGSSPARAAVNSLGVGGTNAHVVVEQAPARPASSPAMGPSPLLLSARNSAALDAQCDRLREFLEENPEVNLADVSYTLMHGRRRFAKRRALAAKSVAEAIEKLREKDPRFVFNHTQLAEEPSVTFMFPGGGAQYVNMAKGLYERHPTFKRWVDRGLSYLGGLVDVDPRDLLFPKAGGERQAKQDLLKPSRQLPLIFIIEVSLAQLWKSLGVEPTALIGHSVGENAAAAFAGVMSYEDGIRLVLRRGQLFDEVEAGGMLSVPLSRKDLETRLPDSLDLACVNAPALCVVSGRKQDLTSFAAELQKADIEAKLIPIDIAAHSRLLDSMLDDFRAHLQSMDLSPPSVPIISNRTGQPLSDNQATSPDYWVEHLRRTVLFADGIETLATDKSRVYLEVGPGRVLGSLARQCQSVPASAVLETLRHADDTSDDDTFLAGVLSRLVALGVKLPDETLWGDAKRSKLWLPTYAFQHQHFWIDAGKATAAAASALPMKEPSADQWLFETSWRKRDLARAETTRGRHWLVFLDAGDLGEEICTKLRASGDAVTVVREGDAFYKLSDGEYMLSYEQGLSGYEALVSDLMASGRVPGQILHLGLLSDQERFRPGSSFFHTNQERGFFSLLLLAQALAGQDYPSPLHVTVVTNGMQRVGDEPMPYPEKATILGPAMVMPRELVGVTCSVVDVELEQNADGLTGLLRATPLVDRLRTAAYERLPLMGPLRPHEAVARIVEELSAQPMTEQVALRRSGRYVRELSRKALSFGGGVGFRPGGTYLITGGLGGIGLSIARHLAQRYQANLVLLGRSKLPPREEYEARIQADPEGRLSEKLKALLELETLGSQVLAVSGDVTHVERTEQVVSEATARFGPIHGVLHAAGTLDDHPIVGKEQSDIDAVLAPKVYGTLVLRRVLEETPLDFMLLFSSTSGWLCPPGQVDYVAANAFMGALAERARGTEERCLAVGWGVWKDVGMAAEAASQRGAIQKPEPQPTSHPLLGERLSMSDGSIRLQSNWECHQLWVLDDHRTADKRALLPGTGYLELLRAAAREVAPRQPVEIRDLLFLSPLYVPDGSVTRMQMDLKPDDQGYSVRVGSGRLDADGSVELAPNAEAKIVLLPQQRPSALDVPSIDARCTVKRIGETAQGIETGQEQHLSFGPRWQVLRRLSVGEGEALARLALPSTFEADVDEYGLHPALLDLATGYAMDLIPGYGAEALWVPVSYRSVKVHAPLSANIWSWAKLNEDVDTVRGLASFDVVITDGEGEVCVEVQHFTIKRLSDTAFLAEEAAPSSKVADQRPLESVRREADGGGEVELSPDQVAFHHNLSQGITSEEGVERIERLLSSDAAGEIFVSSLDLRTLRRSIDERAVGPDDSDSRFSRPQLDSDYEAPRDDIERTLVELWEELLGLDRVGIRDSFFELGGHSLVALRLFAKIKKTYRVDYPMSVLFEAPTVEQCANLLREALGERNGGGQQDTSATRYRHLVRMDTGAADSGRPFFLVAGMFGNVLNLRHLASLVGKGRPCYGLQARGLYGDTPPHETFEEMARDYLEEIRTVQPHGPYLLGGFSGGGIAAFEMAQQLVKQGETVSMLVMLDTPLPNWNLSLTTMDRVEIRITDLKKEKLGLFAQWAKSKLDYRARERLKRKRLEEQIAGQTRDFHSQKIEAAFYRALDRYQLEPIPLEIALFRPKLKVAYQMRDGRRLNHDRNLLLEDNGWGAWARGVRVIEVPGDHDSMVLEPNVRVLASELAGCLELYDGAVVNLSTERDRRNREQSDAGKNGAAGRKKTSKVIP